MLDVMETGSIVKLIVRVDISRELELGKLDYVVSGLLVCSVSIGQQWEAERQNRFSLAPSLFRQADSSQYVTLLANGRVLTKST